MEGVESSREQKQQLAPFQLSPAAAAAAATTTTAAADSSDVEKKIKDNFVKEMSKVIVKILNPYRSPGVKGYIGSTEDFKHLAKKVRLRQWCAQDFFWGRRESWRSSSKFALMHFIWQIFWVYHINAVLRS